MNRQRKTLTKLTKSKRDRKPVSLIPIPSDVTPSTSYPNNIPYSGSGTGRKRRLDYITPKQHASPTNAALVLIPPVWLVTALVASSGTDPSTLSRTIWDHPLSWILSELSPAGIVRKPSFAVVCGRIRRHRAVGLLARVHAARPVDLARRHTTRCTENVSTRLESSSFGRGPNFGRRKGVPLPYFYR